jgi:hypothetical protein
MIESNTTAQETLRGDILKVGGDDFVSMADVQGFIDDGGLADSAPERQRLVVDTIRSLLVDGLVEVGGIPSPSSTGFKTWPGTVDEVMTRGQPSSRDNRGNQIHLEAGRVIHRSPNDDKT